MIHREVMRKMHFIYWFMFFAFTVVFIAALALADKSSVHWLPEAFGFVQLVISAVFVVGALVGSKLIANSVFSRKEVLDNPEKLNETFLSWFMIRMAMAEMAGLTSSIGFLLTANLLLLIIAALMFVVMFSYRPTHQKAESIVKEAQLRQHSR